MTDSFICSIRYLHNLIVKIEIFTNNITHFTQHCSNINKDPDFSTECLLVQTTFGKLARYFRAGLPSVGLSISSLDQCDNSYLALDL